VSRKLSRLFVRQGFTPLFDVPVKTQNPEQPLGTHVFTAVDSQNAGASIRWTVVSLPEQFSPAKKRSVALPDKASEALDRIEMSREAIEQILAIVDAWLVPHRF
jgi:hypothetical protein